MINAIFHTPVEHRYVRACELLGAVTLVLLAVTANASTELAVAASDGKIIEGILTTPLDARPGGAGDTAVILCHGRAYLRGAETMNDVARHFAGTNITSLAISFRGYPAELRGPFPQDGHLDILGAFKHLADMKASRIFVLGSSMGGTLALKALPELEKNPQFAGLILVSVTTTNPIPSKCAKLLVAAQDDAQFYHPMLSCFETSEEPKELLTYPTGGHGQDLLRNQGADVLDAIAAFILGSSAPPAPPASPTATVTNMPASR